MPSMRRRVNHDRDDGVGGEADAWALTNRERNGRGRGRGPPPPPPTPPPTQITSFTMFAPMGVVSPTTTSGRAPPPPPPPPPRARAPASASAVSLGHGARGTSPPPPPVKPKPPTSGELAGVIASLEAAAAAAEREEMEAGEVEIPPPKPPPPKPPKPPPPKPPKPPPPKPSKPPAGPPPPGAMVARAKKMRISSPDDDPVVVRMPMEKPSSSDEEEESESEPEEGEIAPRLVELMQQDDFTAKENDEDELASPTFKKAKPDATSHDLMGGGEFDTLESLTRVQDVSAEVLNNINSPQFRKRTPISPPPKQLVNESKRLDAKLKRLLDVRKLPLVLDLDHTLLNTVLVRDLRKNASALLNAMRLLDADVARATKTNNPLARSVFHLEHMDLLTKLRPGVRLFLEKASELFELHINTMGSQRYADQMATLLDPERRWINGEIRGLGEMEDGILIAPSEKSLDGMLEGLADSCLIFDDTVSVWESHRGNLITCERYLFFPNARKQFGLPGLSLLDVGRDECAEQGMLATAMKVLTSVHKDYFDRYDALNRPQRVADILQEHRKDVLAGVNIVFSHVFPIHTDPTKHPLWTLAEDFGAKCSPALTEETTHVVAAARTTDKVKEATKRGNILIVSPQWLECSILLWKRANERTFSVDKRHHG